MRIEANKIAPSIVPIYLNAILERTDGESDGCNFLSVVDA
jgi:hypothetical protein